jgi:hypothetical protein
MIAMDKRRSALAALAMSGRMQHSPGHTAGRM